MKKVIIIAIIAALLIAFFAFDVDQLLSLEGIKSSQDHIAQLKEAQPLLVGLGFLGIYIAVTALSLPGAAVMTLAAGAFFGVIWGTIIVSFASTIGATFAFLAARFILKESVQAKFGDRLQAINDGIEKEGAFYLFTLRLVPVFPFFLINL
ncbi:MAG: VTT domain-containing protein, partial [Pseudomonadales bacterium]|nr:VTT domain-containing protein [Pseudomonadales bacterium]